MEQSLDKTPEIEIRLKEIRIIPENTCLFFKSSALAVSGRRQCANCKYSSFSEESCPGGSGWCTFKTGR